MQSHDNCREGASGLLFILRLLYSFTFRRARNGNGNERMRELINLFIAAIANLRGFQAGNILNPSETLG